jgi:hypothetical protein
MVFWTKRYAQCGPVGVVSIFRVEIIELLDRYLVSKIPVIVFGEVATWKASEEVPKVKRTM